MSDERDHILRRLRPLLLHLAEAGQDFLVLNTTSSDIGKLLQVIFNQSRLI